MEDDEYDQGDFTDNNQLEAARDSEIPEKEEKKR